MSQDLLNCFYINADKESGWELLHSLIEKIESLKIVGREDMGWNGDTKEVEWEFIVEISGFQCMIHRNCSPQYYGTYEDFLSLYDCRNTSKLKATKKAIVKFIRWYNEQMKLKRNKHLSTNPIP